MGIPEILIITGTGILLAGGVFSSVITVMATITTAADTSAHSFRSKKARLSLLLATSVCWGLFYVFASL